MRKEKRHLKLLLLSLLPKIINKELDGRKHIGTDLYGVSCSVMSDSATSRIVAYQAPVSMEFSRQEY